MKLVISLIIATMLGTSAMALSDVTGKRGTLLLCYPMAITTLQYGAKGISQKMAEENQFYILIAGKGVFYTSGQRFHAQGKLKRSESITTYRLKPETDAYAKLANFKTPGIVPNELIYLFINGDEGTQMEMTSRCIDVTKPEDKEMIDEVLRKADKK